jgi:hypothetical protein
MVTGTNGPMYMYRLRMFEGQEGRSCQVPYPLQGPSRIFAAELAWPGSPAALSLAACIQISEIVNVISADSDNWLLHDWAC